MSQDFNRKDVVAEGYIGRRAILEQRVIEGLETPTFDANNVLRLVAESAETQFVPETYAFISQNRPTIYLPDEGTLWNNWRITMINGTSEDMVVRLYNAIDDRFTLPAGSMSTYILLDNAYRTWTVYRTDAAVVVNDTNTVIRKRGYSFSYATLSGLQNGASAEGSVRLDSNPSDGDTLTISYGGTVETYTFRTAVSEAYDVLIGVSASLSAANLASAINADGTDVYGEGTEASSLVSATQNQDSVTLTALIGGASGNGISLSASSIGMAVTPMSGGEDYVTGSSAIYAIGTVTAGNSVRSISVCPIQAWATADESDFTLSLSIGRYVTEIEDGQEVSVFQPLFYPDGLDIRVTPSDDNCNRDLFDLVPSMTEDVDLFVRFTSDSQLSGLVAGEVRIEIGMEGDMQSVRYDNSTISGNVPLGTIFAYAFDDTPVGFARLDGSTRYMQSNDPFVRKLNGYAEQTGERLIISETEYNAELTAHGSCGKFCWVTNNGVVTNNLRFPTIRNYIKGFGIRRDDVGSYTPENGNVGDDHIRNFTGSFNYFGTGTCDGAFSTTRTNNHTKLATGGTMAEYKATLTVSTASSSNDGTEPRHTVYPYIMCYSTQSINTEISDDTYNQILRRWHQSDPLTPKRATSSIDPSLFIAIPDFNTYSQPQSEAIVRINGNTLHSPFTASSDTLAVVHYRICKMPTGSEYGGFGGISYIYESVIKFSDTSRTYYRTGTGTEGNITWSEWQSIYVPTGQIMAFAGTEVPEGWLRCDGRTLPIDGPYRNLFDVIGHRYSYVREWRPIAGASASAYTYDPVIPNGDGLYNIADPWFMPYEGCPLYKPSLDTSDVYYPVSGIYITFSDGATFMRDPSEDSYRYYAWVGTAGTANHRYTARTDTHKGSSCFWKNGNTYEYHPENTVTDIRLMSTSTTYTLYDGADRLGGLTSYQIPNLIDRTIWGTNSASATGTPIQAGIPNIIGSVDVFNGVNRWSAEGSRSGAFASTTFDTGTGAKSSGDDQNMNLRLDASLSNLMYGNSSTVQPPSVGIVFAIKY